MFSDEIIILSSLICISMVLSVNTLLALTKIPQQYKMSITKIDILVVVYFIVGLVNIAIIRKFDVDLKVFYRWGTILVGYVMFRIFAKKTRKIGGQFFIFIIFSVAGVFQAAFAIFQHIGLASSNHRLFSVTGSFGNPGQLGGFLAVTIIVSAGLCYLLFKEQKKTLSFAVGAGIILQLAALYLTDSRAGFLGVFTGFVVLCFCNLGLLTKKYKSVSFAISILFFICIGVLLYNHRPASVDGRLLIWRVGLNMVFDKPIAGHGVGSFGEKYMLYQADYFKSDPGSRFVMVADNVAYPYNELLHITIEQGIVGLLVLLILFAVVFTYMSKSSGQLTLKAGLAALSIYSMFSYSSYVFALLFLFAALLGLLDSKSVFRLNASSQALVALFALLSIVCGLGVYKIGFYKESSKQTSTFFKKEESNPRAAAFIDKYFEILKYNLHFNQLYSMRLSNTEIIPPTFERLNDLLPSCETYCDIGNVYRKWGDLQKSEEYYTTASWMIPSRLTPNYHLWQIYCEIGDMAKAKNMAKKILSQPIKKESTFTLRTKAEIRIFLSNIDD